MKYVVVNKDGMELAILFPDQVQHAEAVDRTAVNVVGAGFLRETTDGAVVCYGESVSLGIKAKAGDLEAVVLTLRLMMGQADQAEQKFRGAEEVI